MRWRPLTWLTLSLLLLTVYVRVGAFRQTVQPGKSSLSEAIESRTISTEMHPPQSPADPQFPLRVRNTHDSLAQLMGNDHAILLENVLLDTEQPIGLAIPGGLRASADPGSYIVQSRAPLDHNFRALIQAVGGRVVAYIPNNALLITGSAEMAGDLAPKPDVQSVIPYEPYFKMKSSLLKIVMSQPSSALPGQGLPGTVGTPLTAAKLAPLDLNLLTFPDSRDATFTALQESNIIVLGEEASPFGSVFRLRAPASQVASLAALPGVQEIELSHRRIPANDLSRVVVGVTADPITSSNYLGLTGSNVLINVNDTGIDASHPDLAGRVLFDVPQSGIDSDGHGTHVAGIIAGDGSQSTTVSNAPGSIVPPAEFQFRGKAPGARLFAMTAGLREGPASGDNYLQETAAQTNASIANNSWTYAGDTGYGLSAASYDAAVRDALPGRPGSQPLLIVFAAGNSGAGAEDGTGGIPDTIASPATAKNIITVGALEQFRLVTNLTWSCTTNGAVTSCQTNQPWFAATDSSNQVAAFSSRGNVGIGIEGPFGRFKPDVVAPGTFILSARSSQWDTLAYYSRTNPDPRLAGVPDANYPEVLSNLNQSLGPFYRFESGTSLAAADVSGTLALIQQFYRDHLGRTNSPALMKALLINGARSLGTPYDLHPSGPTNWQGWGLIHLPDSAPALLTNLNSGPLLLFDQSPESALATGQARTRFISVSPDAQTQPLRFTLTWTDPPASPMAGIKLVNNLNLVVTNLDTGEVFFGNDIPVGSEFNLPWNTNNLPRLDQVNNVENIYLPPPLGTNYSVTVLAERVNVNAVTANTNDIVQDYALVASGGAGEIADALTVTGASPSFDAGAQLTVLTNTLVGAFDWGTVLLHQRAGANAPLFSTNTIPLPSVANGVLTIGTLNQWHFYVLTNDTVFTNAAFLTFDASVIAVPLSGLDNGNTVTNANRFEADIDLYVSRDHGLTNLDATVLASADMSLGRGGAETIVYSNASPGVYYIGVKSERQEAAEYGFVAEFSALPFAQDDGQGNQILRGFPAPVLIPSGTSTQPGVVDLFSINPIPFTVRRAIVTNTLTAAAFADLSGTLVHNDIGVTLDNHSPAGVAVGQPFVYDDSGEADMSGSRPSDGPGSLRAYGGGPAFGQWALVMTDTNQPATNENLSMFLERQPNLTSGIGATIQSGGCRQDFFYVPPEVTNLSVSVTLDSGQGPISIAAYPIDTSPSNCLSVVMSGSGTNFNLTIDNTSHPPLSPGNYVLRLCNQETGPVSVSSLATLLLAPAPPAATVYASAAVVPIADDAVTISTMLVTNLGTILSAAVGVHIDHPRVSDLVLHLTSPNGTRVLLAENRGGASTDGMGGVILITNITPVSYTGGPEAVTNTFDTGQTSGTINLGYNFYSLPDEMHVYYQGNLIYDSGLVSGSGTTNVSYGPGASTTLTVVMNEGGNTNNNTAWFYSLTSTALLPLYLTFSENTNVAVTPIKFAPAPLTNINYSGSSVASNGIFYHPEESLDALAGQPALGTWKLEIADTRAGATAPAPRLEGWQLGLLFRNTVPVPVPLSPGVATTNLLGAGQTQWFTVDVPEWASFASNTLVTASAPVTIWFSQAMVPGDAATGSLAFLAGSTAGVQVLRTNGLPPLIPSSRYYLGIQNTNASAIMFAVQVDFDVANVVSLQSGIPYSASNSGTGSGADYYVYLVSTNAVRAQFEINNPSADLTLVARRGLPLPALGSYDYLSANPGTNDELIVIYNYSSPVPLAPGKWYLGVINNTAGPALYSVMATESLDYGTNLVVTSQTVTSNSFCLSWISLPGVHYYLQGKLALTDANWVTISPTITANDALTTDCVTLPSQFVYFRVHEGLALTPPPLLISRISLATNGVWLNWAASTNTQFNVQWTSSLNPPVWAGFTNRLSSTNGAFLFLDDGSQAAGLGTTRYYRLRQLP